MSYCRLGPDSDLYLYRHWKGFNLIVAHEKGSRHFHIEKIQDVLKKCEELRKEGIKIPEATFDRLKEEVLK